MLRTGESSSDCSQHAYHIAPDQGGHIKPQSGEDFTSEENLLIWFKAFVLPSTQDKLVNCLIDHAPHDVFAHTVPPVDV